MADEPEFRNRWRVACNGQIAGFLEHFQAKWAPVHRQKVL
jgi:hypothetical protein